MSNAIEALYIYDQHNTPILEHVYRGRPLSARTLLPLYLNHPDPRPSLIYLPNTAPSTLVFSIIHAQLLFLCPCSNETEPLFVLEFLHRVVDALEEFLGAPLLASKIESSYDIVAQLLSEVCDAGNVANTEPNALRDVVEVPGWVNKILGGVVAGLPGSSPSLLSSQSSSSGGGPLSSLSSASLQNTPALPWRRANVRHTSNELYVDILESLSVILAPSGRPLSALATGSIAFTSKISGVPDLLLTLSSPGGGKANVGNVVERPVFHPCVRLARWRERPGELSFVPPDGRFVLSAYEVNLLPSLLSSSNQIPKSLSSHSPYPNPNLFLPATVEIDTLLGPNASDFEVRLLLSPSFASSAANASSSSFSSSSAAFAAARSSSGGGAGISNSGGGIGIGATGSSSHPTLEEISITLPIPPGVRNITGLRATRGDAHYNPGDNAVEWRVPSKEASASSLSTATSAGGSNGSNIATLRGTVVGPLSDDDDDEDDDEDEGTDSNTALALAAADPYDYPDTYQASSQTSSSLPSTTTISPAAEKKSKKKHRKHAPSTSLSTSTFPPPTTTTNTNTPPHSRHPTSTKTAKYRPLMPSAALLSFQVRGWLPSGLRVESLAVNQRASRGLGEAVRPYKGVKYLTVSRRGVEARC
ncbi:MAG: hypothetical protein M1819_006522 [Sarea resinae]|nr:MAG: hypothetical protein M1819_000614 [Sarea resinae]KAI9828815.1 MAG: hypothetical protein M1819_006522 [Sarea resinae]